jgi:hypothetical protein
MPEKPKMSDAETRALDVSACYQMGKTARQREVPLGDNPWAFGTEFNTYWAKGWVDTDQLLTGTKNDKEGYQG